jgi:anti-sigma factor RsiW
MTACDSAALSQYLDSELPPRERLGLEKHLRGCATCRQELAVLRRMDQVIVDWGARNVPVPSVTESRIQESVNRRRSLGPLVSVSRMMPAAVGSCAAALLLLVSANIGWLYQSGGSVAQSDTSAHVQRIIESNS